jgi:hypothetical protein
MTLRIKPGSAHPGAETQSSAEAAEDGIAQAGSTSSPSSLRPLRVLRVSAPGSTAPDRKPINEHGAWGLAIAAGVLGWALAPSWAGLALAGGLVAAVPLRLVLRRRLGDRRLAAGAVIAGIGAGAVLPAAAPALVPAGVAAAGQILADPCGRRRSTLGTLLGGAALAAAGSGIALAGGAGWAPALALAVLLLGYQAALTVYLRARRPGGTAAPALVLATHGGWLALVAALAAAALLPWLAAAATAAAGLRAAVGLRAGRASLRTLGLQEIPVLSALVLLTAAGGLLGW